MFLVSTKYNSVSKLDLLWLFKSLFQLYGVSGLWLFSEQDSSQIE